MNAQNIVAAAPSSPEVALYGAGQFTQAAQAAEYMRLIQNQTRTEPAVSALSTGFPNPRVHEEEGAPGVWRHPRHQAGHFYDTPHNHSDFPKVKWWTKQQWTKHKRSISHDFGRVNLRGGTRASNGENVRYTFIQDAQGEPISGYCASAIRSRFREYAVYLYNRGRAPDTWSRGLDLQDKIGYERWMRATCPEVQYCDGNWICTEIAIKEYPQWKPAFEKRVARKQAHAAALLQAKCSTEKNSRKSEHLGLDYEDAGADVDEQNESESPDAVDTFLNSAAYKIADATPTVNSSANGLLKRLSSDLTEDSDEAPKALAKRACLFVPNSDENALGPTPVVPRPSLPNSELDPAAVPRLSLPVLDSAKMPAPVGIQAPNTVNPDADAPESASFPETTRDAINTVAGSINGPPGGSELPEGAAAIHKPASILALVPDLFGGIVIKPSPVGVSQTQASASPGKPILVRGQKADKKSIKTEANKKGKATMVWPPPPEADSLRDKCARVWVQQPENINNTREDFNIWYRQAYHYQKKKLADLDGAAIPAPPTAADTGSPPPNTLSVSEKDALPKLTEVAAV
ncbi:hypothetical protein C2E23DRAFT_907671 [Lenzites betulinus]|nr:hypothetical protein C2E23DRAFT_907671 [Lenzites betulinus]